MEKEYLVSLGYGVLAVMSVTTFYVTLDLIKKNLIKIVQKNNK